MSQAYRGIISCGVLVVAGALLAGCAQSPAVAPSAPVASPSASPSATPDAKPEDILFVVAAKARAVDGTTIDLELTGHLPVDATEPGAAPLVTELAAGCAAMLPEGAEAPTPSGSPPAGEPGDDAGTGATGTGADGAGAPPRFTAEALEAAGSALMRVTVTSTPRGLTFVAPLELGLGSAYAPKVARGDGVLSLVSNDGCLGHYQASTSGTVTAVTDYETATNVPDPDLWITGFYGFGVPVDSGATIESCTAELTPLGTETASGQPGWDAPLVTALSCGIGYIGE